MQLGIYAITSIPPSNIQMRKLPKRYLVIVALCLLCYAATALSIDVQTWIGSRLDDAPSIKVKTSLQKAAQFEAAGQLESMLYHLDVASELLQQHPNMPLYFEINLLLGKLYTNDLQSYDDAKPYLNTALKLSSKTEQPSTYLEVLDVLAKTYYWKFESEEAMKYAVEGLELSKTRKDNHYAYVFTQWVGRTFAIQKDLNKAIEYYQEALALALKSDDPFKKYEGHLNLGCGHYKNKQAAQGLKYLEQCYQYLDAIPNRDKREADVWMWSGIMHGATKNYDEGIRLLNKAVPVFNRLDIPHRRMHTHLELGNIYLKEKRNEEAIQIIETAFQLDPEHISAFERKFGYTLLYQAYKNLGNFKKSIQYLEQLNSVNARLDSINNARDIQELEKIYKEQERIQTIEKQNTTRRSLALLLLFLSLLLIGTFSALYFLNQNRKKLAKQHAIIESQTHELRQLDQLKSNFFANVSHELRTPLTLILGPISSALKSGTLDKRNFNLLQKAQQSGKDLKKMVGAILDLSKLEAQKMDVQWQATLLFPLTRRIAAAFESQAQMKGIKYTFHYQAERDLYVELDKEKTTIILNNLLSNALKFTPHGGAISFSVEDLGNILQFTVTDTGRGIHPDDVGHIFDRFYQSKQGNAPVEGGTGIGLALCREFAELMGGKVSVQSQLEKGSTFIATIARREVLGTIPDADKSVEVAPTSDNVAVVAPVASPKSRARLQRILVVEDNASLRTYLETILSPYYQVSLAENGRKALDTLEYSKLQAYPDLILSDIMMPEMDGYQLLQALKSNDNLRSIPTIMLTARAAVEDKLKALRIGVDDYLLKPFEEEELLARIENLLNNYQERRAQAQDLNEQEPPDEASIVVLPQISQEDQVWLEELEQHLNENLANSQYSITQLSYDIALSERQLRRRIKQLVGLSPSQYFKAIRLQHARQLLEARRYNTIAQTAAAVGFQDAGAFSRNFSQQFGKSPAAYLSH